MKTNVFNLAGFIGALALLPSLAALSHGGELEDLKARVALLEQLLLKQAGSGSAEQQGKAPEAVPPNVGQPQQVQAAPEAPSDAKYETVEGVSSWSYTSTDPAAQADWSASDIATIFEKAQGYALDKCKSKRLLDCEVMGCSSDQYNGPAGFEEWSFTFKATCAARGRHS